MIVELMGLQIHALLVTPNDREVETIDDFEVGLALSGAGHVGDRLDHYFLRGFQHRRINQPLVHLLEVFDIAYLGGLGDSLTMAEALPTIVGDSLLSGSGHPREN